MDSFKILKGRLDNLECHFTWSLSGNVHHLQDYLKECSERDCAWKGHLYNLLGYVTYHISTSPKEALMYLQRAEEVLKGGSIEGRGPHLLVNQANLAWVHYHLGEQAESKAYLEKVDKLKQDFPAPAGSVLHPEVYGEKGWTQVQFDNELRQKAIENFELALRGDQDEKRWRTGLALAKYRVNFKAGDKKLREKIIQELVDAKRIDPDNLRLAAVYLAALAQVGMSTKDTEREARDIVQRLRPWLHGLGEVLYFFRLLSLDSAVEVAEDMVERYPNEGEAQKQLAACYKMKIFKSLHMLDNVGQRKMLDNADVRELMEKCIHIYEEVTSFYPRYYNGKMVLADIYALSGNTVKADQMYMDLVREEQDLNPATRQLLYFKYANHLWYKKSSCEESIDYYKKAAEIPTQSSERKKRIQIRLAVIYAQSGNTKRADEIYMDLLEEKEDLDPPTLQLLYYKYGNHLYHIKKSQNESIDYHKKAAEIPTQSSERKKSIQILKSVATRRGARVAEINAFLLGLEQN